MPCNCPVNSATCFLLLLSDSFSLGPCFCLILSSSTKKENNLPASRLNRKQTGDWKLSILQSVGVAVMLKGRHRCWKKRWSLWQFSSGNPATAAPLFFSSSTSYKAVSHFLPATFKVSNMFWLRCESNWLFWGSANLFGLWLLSQGGNWTSPLPLCTPC